jgi:hypothetical protein
MGSLMDPILVLVIISVVLIVAILGVSALLGPTMWTKGLRRRDF